MAKNYTKKEGSGSLIFIWILILLLAIGSVLVFVKYKENHSDFIKNDVFAQELSKSLDKPVGKITEKDLAAAEVVAFIKSQKADANGSITVDPNADVEYESSAIIVLNNQQITVPMEYNEFTEYLKYFTGVKSIQISKMSYASMFGMIDPDTTEFDFNLIPADTYKKLEEISVYGVNIKNFENVAAHTGLKNLYVMETNVKDVSSIKSLTQLEGLGLSGASITDVSVISDMATLKNLEISGTAIQALPSFDKLTSLENLALTSNGLTDISALSALNNEKLVTIDLTGNSIEDFSAISHIDEAKVTRDQTTEEKEAEEAANKTEEESSNEADENANETDAAENADKSTDDDNTEEATDNTASNETESTEAE